MDCSMHIAATYFILIVYYYCRYFMALRLNRNCTLALSDTNYYLYEPAYMPMRDAYRIHIFFFPFFITFYY